MADLITHAHFNVYKLKGEGHKGGMKFCISNWNGW